MKAWTPIDPDTSLEDLMGRSVFIDAGPGRGLMAWVAAVLTPAPRRAFNTVVADQLRVTFHASYGWPRRAQGHFPQYLPISGACLSRGVVPQRIVAVPTPEWPELRAPRIAVNGGYLTLKDLVDAGPPASVRLQGALAMADEVKTTYGRMLADVAYRIEQSALFDSAVATTRSFDNAMAVWDDLDTDHAPEDEVVRKAGMLKLAFANARAHAEMVGLSHLPATARNEARRAAGAARLAAGAKTDAERAAAQQQVNRILRSLALYYLPDPDREVAQLTAGRSPDRRP